MHRSMEQDKEPRNKPTILQSLIFDRGSKHIQGTKDSLFNKWFWENSADMCRKIIQEHLLTPYIRIKSKWIKDLNVRPETIKIKEENLGSQISDIARSNFFIRYISSGKGNKKIK